MELVRVQEQALSYRVALKIEVSMIPYRLGLSSWDLPKWKTDLLVLYCSLPYGILAD